MIVQIHFTPREDTISNYERSKGDLPLGSVVSGRNIFEEQARVDNKLASTM